MQFLEHLLSWRCYGDPTFTFSDVERTLQREVQRRDYLPRYRAIADATLRATEVAMLEKLETKYRRSEPIDPVVFREHVTPSPLLPPEPTEPIQGRLF